MAPKNIKITKEFAIKTEEIVWRGDVLSLKIPGKKSEQIRTVLTKFVYTKLEDVNPTVYLRLKKRGKLKEDEMTFKGGNEKTVERVYTDQTSSIDLFDIIGSYLYEDKWNGQRQNFVIDKSIIEKFDVDSSKLSLNEPINWEGHFRKVYIEGLKFNIIPIIGSDILDLKELSMDEYFGEISYTPLNVLHQKEMLLLKEKEQATKYKRYIESLQNDEFLTQNSLQDFDRILILGNPGTGKTIYSRWLCNQWATGKVVFEGVPVHIELKGVSFEEEKPLLHYLNNLFENELSLIIGQSSFSQKDISQFFFILDGFDEITPNQQEQLLELIFEKNKGVRFMLLTRPYAMLGHENKIEADTAFELLGFGKNSQKLYIEKILASNADRFSAENFWELTSKHPFLSEFLPTPLTLSYLLILFIEQEKSNEQIPLVNIDSSYTLQQQVLYSLRRHFVDKAERKVFKIDKRQHFDDAIVSGGKLAYSMEKKLIFVVTSADWSYSVKYKCIIKLNEVGFGRLEFLTKEKKKDLNGERGERFSFITATIQEYLAAYHFVEQIDEQDVFLVFFSSNISWNFCKMVIGKCVVDKKYRFLNQIKKILTLNKAQKPNVNNLYRYLLFFSELDTETLKKELLFEELKSSFKDSIQVIAERPTWEQLLSTVWQKLFLKLSRKVRGQFNKFYCEYSQQLLNDLLSKNFLDIELLFKLQVLRNIGNVPSVYRDEGVGNTIIDWILQLNDVIIAMELQMNSNPRLNEKLGLFVYRLIGLVDNYVALIEEGGNKSILLVYEKVKKILSAQWKPLQPTVQSLLELIILKSNELTVEDLLKSLNEGLEEKMNLKHIRFLLESLEWKLKLQKLEYTSPKVFIHTDFGGTLRRIVHEYNLTTLGEAESEIKTNVLQAIVTLINYIPSYQNYTLLFDILEESFSFPDRFQIKGIEYSNELDVYVRSIIEDYKDQEKDILQTLLLQIFDLEAEEDYKEDCHEYEPAEYIEILEAYIRSAPNSDEYTEESLSQVLPLEIADKQLLIMLSLVKVLYYLEPGTILFSKNRDFFYNSFEKIVLENWCILSEYIQIIHDEDVEYTVDISIQYLWYFRKLVFRNDFYDRKFLINRLLNGNIQSHPLIKQELLLSLFYKEMPLYEDQYWNFLLTIKKGNRDLEGIVNLLCNNGIYLFKNNIEPLQKIWTWFKDYSLEDLSILDDGIYNPYNIFAAIVNSLKYIILQKLDDNPFAIEIIKIIASLLGKKDFQESITFLYSVEDSQNQTNLVIAYLLMLRFNVNCFNTPLREYLNKKNYDQKTIFSFLMSLSELREDYSFLKEILGKRFYQELEAFYSYYEDIEIDPKLDFIE